LRLVPDATTGRKADSCMVMYARAVEEASTRLRELRHEQWGSLGVGAVALVIAVGATQVYEPLAVPLFVGGIAVGILGVRAMWCRWDLLERLAGERDAQTIADVRAYAAREATAERRRNYAALIRMTLTEPSLAAEAHVSAAAEVLEELASELEDESLALDPACAVACMRLLTDLEASPLLSAARPPEELRSRVLQIRSGFQALEA
jgi:hypothetical protein